MTDGETEEVDWSRYSDPVEGVRINDEGYYECKECAEVLEATGELRTTDEGRRRAVWECPSFHDRYHI